MKRAFKKIILFLLCFALLLGINPIKTEYEPVSARSIKDIEAEIKEYKALLSELQTTLSDINKELDNIEGAGADKQAQFVELQLLLAELDAERVTNLAILDSYDLRINEVMTEQAIVQEDYEYRVAMYKKLMQFIYENGEPNAFELLFSSDNFSDFLAKRDHFNDIMNAASGIIKDIEVSMGELDALEADLQETKNEYAELVEDIEARNVEVEAQMTAIEEEIANLGISEDELSAEIQVLNGKIREVKNKIAALEKEREEYYNSIADMTWPIKAGNQRLTSRFGWRNDPFGLPTTEFHKGIDIACARGTPIYAVKDGVVTRASWNGGYGNCVIIYHGGGVSSLYAHCDNATSSRPIYEVKVGDSVKQGQVIAYVGTTGRSTGYHLHFGIIDTGIAPHPQGGQYHDPAKYLPEGYFK